MAQISEFSLIFMAMGITLGHVDTDALGLVALVGLITIAGSVYMITYSHILYNWLEPLLSAFERRDTPAEHGIEQDVKGRYDAIVFGLGRFGTAIATRLERIGLRVLGVDFNPASVRQWQQDGRDAVYGDAMDPEFIASLPLAHAKWSIATMPAHDTGVFHEDPRIALINALKEQHFQGRIAVTNRHDAETVTLKKPARSSSSNPSRTPPTRPSSSSPASRSPSGWSRWRTRKGRRRWSDKAQALVAARHQTTTCRSRQEMRGG